MEPEQQFDLILKNGWRQGSIVGHELVCAANLPIEETHQQHYLVMSHSCDLTNPNANLERVVEVLRAEVTTAFDKASASARTPRKLALMAESSGGAQIPLLVRIETRQFIKRELFIAQRPNPDLRLRDEALSMFSIWMSRRYRRPELPAELVNRLGEKFPTLKELGKKHRATFSRILISLSSWEELPKEQNYRFKLLGLVPQEGTIPQPAKIWATSVDALLADGLHGLEVELTQVESESDVAISILREFRTLDFDFLSFGAGEFNLVADE